MKPPSMLPMGIAAIYLLPLLTSGDGRLKNHRQLEAVFLRALYGFFVACVGMAHDAGGGVVSQYALQACCSLRCAVRHDHLPGMLGEAPAIPDAVVARSSGRTT